MTSYTTSITTAFDLQRSTIEQSQQALSNTVEFQKRFNDVVLDSVGTVEETQQQGLELTRTAIHNYLDAVETTVPGAADSLDLDEIRATVDEQFAQLASSHAEAFDAYEAQLSEGADAYDEFTTDYLAAVNEQIDRLLEAHEDVEAQTVETLEGLEAQIEDVQAQVEDVQQTAQDSLEA